MNKVLISIAVLSSLGFPVFANDKAPQAQPSTPIATPYWGTTPVTPYPAQQTNNQFPSGWKTPPQGQFPPMNYGYPTQPNFAQRPRNNPMPMRAPWQGQGRPSYPTSNNFFPTSPMNSGNPFNFNTPNMQASKMSPFGNSFSPSNDMAKNMPTPWKNSNNWNPWSNGQNQNMMPFLPTQNNNKKKAWGSVRNIWPDFYTEFTEEAWDKSTNSPYDMGRMPGGWRAPSLSSPDPVTVGDAVLNQFPPIMEEMGNMMDFAN
ncbi:MAG: hypothetical protein KAH22_03315 [Thiotrichaceae bacterium]|nr:hypothetical protein [Thiotrichaceae bacterium]